MKPRTEASLLTFLMIGYYTYYIEKSINTDEFLRPLLILVVLVGAIYFYYMDAAVDNYNSRHPPDGSRYMEWEKGILWGIAVFQSIAFSVMWRLVSSQYKWYCLFLCLVNCSYIGWDSLVRNKLTDPKEIKDVRYIFYCDIAGLAASLALLVSTWELPANTVKDSIEAHRLAIIFSACTAYIIFAALGTLFAAVRFSHNPIGLIWIDGQLIKFRERNQ
jgi:hypothetical protein